MSVLTPKQIEKAVSLAQRDAQSRWEWGDWTLEVCGPVGEHGIHDGSHEKLSAAIAEISDENADILMPEIYRLRDYRVAASTIPPTLRDAVSIEAGRLLGQKTRDRLELHRLIEALKNAKGIVTTRAVREHFEMASKDGPHLQRWQGELPEYEPPLPIGPAARVKMARKLLEDPETARKVVAAPGKASNIVTQAVSERNAINRRAREAAQAERDQAEALPITAYEQRILGRFNDIALELAPNTLPYDELSPVGAARIADALERIAENATASADTCRPTPTTAIDGYARDMPTRTLTA